MASHKYQQNHHLYRNNNNNYDNNYNNNDDNNLVRAFASEAGGAGSNPGRVTPKTLKMVPVATLLGAQH